MSYACPSYPPDGGEEWNYEFSLAFQLNPLCDVHHPIQKNIALNDGKYHGIIKFQTRKRKVWLILYVPSLLFVNSQLRNSFRPHTRPYPRIGMQRFPEMSCALHSTVYIFPVPVCLQRCSGHYTFPESTAPHLNQETRTPRHSHSWTAHPTIVGTPENAEIWL